MLLFDREMGQRTLQEAGMFPGFDLLCRNRRPTGMSLIQRFKRAAVFPTQVVVHQVIRCTDQSAAQIRFRPSADMLHLQQADKDLTGNILSEDLIAKPVTDVAETFREVTTIDSRDRLRFQAAQTIKFRVVVSHQDASCESRGEHSK